MLQLVQQGKVKLTDPIADFVDGVPNGSTVTIAQLLNMTSGLASYTLDPAWQDAFFADPHRVWTPDELVAIALRVTPLFAPGTQYNYSNTNTALLGKVIEKVTGMSYQDALQQGILSPLGLTQTSFPAESAAFPAPHAQGYTLQSPTATPTSPTVTTDWNPSWGWSAGEIISTGRDLLAYGRALGTGQGLLSPEVQEQRLTSFPGSRDVYSYGFALGCVGGWVGHTGELPGYNTALYYQTDTDTTVAIITNSDIASGACTQSATLATNDTGVPCSTGPTGRLLVAVANALGTPFALPAQK